MSWGARLSLGAAALAFAFVTGAGAAEASFSAHGSVEQVYVTGLAPGAQMSLLNRRGRTVATKRADALGGLLFRNVRPGTGYRVRPSGGGAEVGAADGALDAVGAAEHGRLQPDDPVRAATAI